jgi:hypothetical protein
VPRGRVVAEREPFFIPTGARRSGGTCGFPPLTAPGHDRPPLCHLDRSEAQWRDLRFSGPFLEMCSSLLAATDHVWVFIGNPGERSGRTCGVCVKSPLNSRSAYPIEPRSVRSEFSLQRSNRPQIFTLPQITHCVVTLGQSQVRPAVTHLPRLITQIEDR